MREVSEIKNKPLKYKLIYNYKKEYD